MKDSSYRMVFPPEYITKEAGESHGLYRDSSKVSSSDCGKFWLDLNPMTKLIMVLCGVATSILLPGFAFGFAWAILLLIFASTCGKGKQMGAHGIYFCGIRHCFGDGTGIFL